MKIIREENISSAGRLKTTVKHLNKNVRRQ